MEFLFLPSYEIIKKDPFIFACLIEKWHCCRSVRIPSFCYNDQLVRRARYSRCRFTVFCHFARMVVALLSMDDLALLIAMCWSVWQSWNFLLFLPKPWAFCLVLRIVIVSMNLWMQLMLIKDSDGKEDYLTDDFLIFYTDKNGLILSMELRRYLLRT